MNLFVVGINHKTAPVEIRERLSFGPHSIADANRLLKERAGLAEGLILSTCNRVEIYAVGNGNGIDHAAAAKDFLSEFHNVNLADFKDRLYTHKDEDTVKHLFRVASGLDSMVIGEVEILGQVKKAYRNAVDSRTSGRVLNKLLQTTFNAAKRVRTDTFIARGPVSVSSVAMRLTKKILGGLKDKKALIVGTGKIGEQLILYLKKNGVNSTLVANRTFKKAQELAEKFDAEAVKFDELSDSLKKVDIVIASTGAPHCIIKKEDIARLMPERRQRPLFIIDLAVPRDVETGVNKIDNVYLYDIDDLQKIADKNLALRKNELDNCNRIIVASCRKFLDWMESEKERLVPLETVSSNRITGGF